MHADRVVKKWRQLWRQTFLLVEVNINHVAAKPNEMVMCKTIYLILIASIRWHEEANSSKGVEGTYSFHWVAFNATPASCCISIGWLVDVCHDSHHTVRYASKISDTVRIIFFFCKTAVLKQGTQASPHFSHHGTAQNCLAYTAIRLT